MFLSVAALMIRRSASAIPTVVNEITAAVRQSAMYQPIYGLPSFTRRMNVPEAADLFNVGPPCDQIYAFLQVAV
ncbi:hypothetical protein D3C80_2204990 [compost metagenome]